MPSSAPPNSIFEIGDVLAAADFGGFSLSPDGTLLVCARIEYVRSLAARLSRITVLSLSDTAADLPAPETIVFTGDCEGWSPEFHDDGSALLFLTDYAGEARPWIATEPDAVPAAVEGVGRMAAATKWRPGLSRRGFAFLSFATREEQGFDDPIIWGRIPAVGFRHLFYSEVAGEPPRKLTAGPEDVYDFAWAPDGESLAVLASPSFEMERHLDNELRVLASDGSLRARHPMPRGLNAFLSFSPAGTHVAFIGHGTDAKAGKPELFTLRLADGRVDPISANVPGYVSRYDWAPGGSGLFFPAAVGVRTPLFHAAALPDAAGFSPAKIVYEPAGFLGGLSVAKRGNRIALRIEGPRTPPCLVVAVLEGDASDPTLGPLRALTPRSARKEARVPGDATVIEARAPDGRPVESIVLHPRRGTPGKRPLCVWLHGGPNEFCALSYQPWWQLFVARGFTVLAPNFRGSGSYSTERVRWNVGDLGGGDADDVIAAIEAAAEGPLGGWIDPRQTVLFGWSYGAFLAFHVARKLAARDGGEIVVKRLVAGGGVYDWLSHYGQAELRFPFRDYLGGSPLLDSKKADARSPVRHVSELCTRAPHTHYLLVHGINDGRASPMQARTMHRALGEAGARAELILYPREAHVLVEPEHVRDLLDRATNRDFVPHDPIRK